MNIRRSAGALLVPLALGTAGLGSIDCYAASEKPNFINIIIDDMGFSDLGIFGSEIPTPHIDQLGEQGIIMTNFYAAPSSTPGRGMLFTGKSNHAAGVGIMASMPVQDAMKDEFGENKPEYEGRLSLEAVPFMEVLQANDYHTMFTGKWDLSDKAPIWAGQDPDDIAAHDPFQRGFDVTRAALIKGGGNHYSADSSATTPYEPWELYKELVNTTYPEWLYTSNGVGISAFSEDFYSTEYYTKMAKNMLTAWDQAGQTEPFYLCVSYTAPHNPVQAPEYLTELFLDTYRAGWDEIREARFAKQKTLGFWPEDAVLPAIPDGRAWADVPAGQDIFVDGNGDPIDPDGNTTKNYYGGKEYSAKEMAAYAAMVYLLDYHVGQLVSHLKAIGAYENTVIMIHSDNGAGNGIFKPLESWTWLDNSYDNIGNRDSYTAVDTEWTITSDTPFTTQKGSKYEAGWHTPAIIHYPKWKAAAGMKVESVTSVTDFAPLILDLAGIAYPETYNGEPTTPMSGIVPLKEKNPAVIPLNGNFFVVGAKGVQENQTDRYVAFEMIGTIGLRKGNWKMVKENCNSATELFNLDDDPFEQTDLAASNPTKLAELEAIYTQYALDNNIVPYTCASGDVEEDLSPFSVY
jgi:arylsulfatase